MRESFGVCLEQTATGWEADVVRIRTEPQPYYREIKRLPPMVVRETLPFVLLQAGLIIQGYTPTGSPLGDLVARLPLGAGTRETFGVRLEQTPAGWQGEASRVRVGTQPYYREVMKLQVEPVVRESLQDVFRQMVKAIEGIKVAA